MPPDSVMLLTTLFLFYACGLLPQFLAPLGCITGASVYFTLRLAVCLFPFVLVLGYAHCANEILSVFDLSPLSLSLSRALLGLHGALPAVEAACCSSDGCWP